MRLIKRLCKVWVGHGFSRAAQSKQICGLYSLLKNSILGGAALSVLR
jgi:hypothetical protein